MSFAAPIAQQIWDQKYRLKHFDGTPIDERVEDTWRRIASSLAQAEDNSKYWETRFYQALEDFKFLPAGRITAGAGSGRDVTLFNCLASTAQILTAEYGIVGIGDVAGQTVTILDGNGQWISAPILAHGEQPTACVSLKGGYNGGQKSTVNATAGHRWLLANGSEKTTSELVAGDALKRIVRTNDLAVQHTRDYFKGVQHGVIYGDGSVEPAGVFRIRLCGEKSELAEYFSDWAQSTPPSFNGDTLYRGASDVDLKALPAESATPAYRQGFLRGWFAADGAVCNRDHRPMLTCGLDESNWIMQQGAVSGMEVMYVSKLTETTNYGLRNKTLYNVSFNRCTMIPEDFIRAHHRKRFGDTPVYTWQVVSVGEYADPEPVFCPVVPTTASFQLAGGIHTGNCFVMGTIPDSMSGIFDMLKEAALTMQQGGGIGYDFSTIRPKGAEVKGVAADASGPLTFMDVWDAMCRTVMSAGSRRGAMMATMRCDHPDIELFIDAKRDPAKLRMFNLSVLVTDDFMAAVKDDALWPLMHEVFPGKGRDIGSVVGADGVRRYIYKVVPARALWEKIMRSTYDYAEPGVIFIDRINSANNLKYIEKIASTNPCAEQPLPPYGACLLGSINLARFVSKPFTVESSVMWRLLRETVCVAVRMMDNVIDVTGFPLPEQEHEAKNKRRIGLGVTGLADMLTMLGLTYGHDDAVKFTEDLMRQITEACYWASIELAMEKGSFPLFDADEYLSSDFMLGMDEELRETIRSVGIRNSHLTSIAPTGTISLYAGNVSSGIEPIFAYGYTRKVLQPDGSKIEERVRDYAVALFEKHFYDTVYNPGDFKSSAWSDGYLPATFVTAQDLPPDAHLRMQAAAQRWIDSSISKTINLPREISFEDFEAVYLRAYDLGCKGCTTYRPNDVTGSVLTVEEAQPEPIAVDGDEGGACELRVDPETGQLIKSCE